MSHRNKRWNGRAQGAPAEVFERALRGEDAADHKRFDPLADRKTLQLCRQVQRALTLALDGESADDELQEIYVESVVPIGGASQLLVRIALASGTAVPSAAVIARLNGQATRLRMVVAQSICRKRAPSLSFVAVMPEMDLPEGGVQ